MRGDWRGLQPHEPLLLGPNEAAVLGGGRLAAVFCLLVLLDPAPPLGQLEPPRPRRHPRHRRGWRMAVIGDEVPAGGVLGFRRGGDVALGKTRREASEWKGIC